MSKNGLLILFIGASCIGFAPIFSKLAIETDLGGLSPTGVAFWRLSLAFPVYLAAMLKMPPAKTETKRPKVQLRTYWPLIFPGLFFGTDLAFWHWSFEFTSLANATLIANLAAVIIGFVGWIWFKETINRLYPVGALLAVTGLGLLVGFSFEATHSSLKGDLLGIITATCYASYMISIKVLANRFSIVQIMMATSLVGSLGLGFAAMINGESLWPEQPITWLPLLGLVLSSQLAGQTLIAHGLKSLPASLSGGILLWQPVMAAILAWIIFDQQLSIGQIGAGILVLIGIYTVKLGVQPKAALAKTALEPNP